MHVDRNLDHRYNHKCSGKSAGNEEPLGDECVLYCSHSPARAVTNGGSSRPSSRRHDHEQGFLCSPGAVLMSTQPDPGYRIISGLNNYSQAQLRVTYSRIIAECRVLGAPVVSMTLGFAEKGRIVADASTEGGVYLVAEVADLAELPQAIAGKYAAACARRRR